MDALYLSLAIFTAVLLLSFAVPMLRRAWVFHMYVFKYVAWWLGDLTRIRPVIVRMTGKRYQRLTRPLALRLFCEDMGVTFVKFGQIIASSSGMFPERYVVEFQKVLDKVRCFDYQHVTEAIEDELGEGGAQLKKIDPKPLASASVAQVHSAELTDGTEVVIKIQRPGIKKIIKTDMAIMRLMAGIAQKTLRDAKLINPVGIVEDLAETLREETDFRKEAANLEQFNEIMAEHHHTRVRAPRPHLELVTERVLVMERFYGTRVDDADGIRARGVDAEESLIEGMQAWFRCVVFHGFFHGDVHAGNLMLLDNEDLGFLDFGIVGRFDDRQRRLVTDYIIGFASKDFQKVAAVISEMGGVGEGVDMRAFAEDLEEVYGPLTTKSFGEVNYGDILPQIHRVARRHRMRMPKEFMLITKQLLYFDRYAKLLAPNINIFTDPRLIMSMMQDIVKVRATQSEQQSQTQGPV